jgi:predicted AAA+ superfamily ATPase
MNYISRKHEKAISDTLKEGKVAILYGPRQVGKTTLARNIASKIDKEYLYLNCDEPDIAFRLSNKTSTEIGSLVGAHSVVVIDEAQRVENIGITLKLLADNYPDVRVIATGSSSFELADSINEPLTGRAYYFTVWPLSLAELSGSEIVKQRMLGDMLVYGQYPEIILSKTLDRERYLSNVTNNYLYRDLMNVGAIRSEATLVALLKLLALQIGGLVSFNELARSLGIDVSTVRRLMDLLEKAYVIHTLMPLTSNDRNSISKQRKVYFVDLGVRNALLGVLTPIEFRDDAGALFENFCINEMRKNNMLESMPANDYFWRNYIGAEVDYVQIRDKKIKAFECKWSAKRSPKPPKAFAEKYSDAEYETINSENFVKILTGDSN